MKIWAAAFRSPLEVPTNNQSQHEDLGRGFRSQLEVPNNNKSQHEDLGRGVQEPAGGT